MTLQPAALPVMPPPPPSLCDAAAREPIRTAAIASSGRPSPPPLDILPLAPPPPSPRTTALPTLPAIPPNRHGPRSGGTGARPAARGGLRGQ